MKALALVLSAVFVTLILWAAYAPAIPPEPPQVAPRPPGGSNLAAPLTLDIQADIGGSDLLRITPSGLTWLHKNSDPPANVTVNGLPWDVSQNPSLPVNGSLSFLQTADLSSAKVLSRSGQDIVALEQTDDGLAVYFANCPYTTGHYEIKIDLSAVAPATQPSSSQVPAGQTDVSPLPTLDIRAKIDGSDILSITPKGLTWIHKYFNAPADVSINGVHWNVSQDLSLPLTGPLAFLQNVDLSTAKVLKRSGRDTIALEHTDEGLAVYFADCPSGAGRYGIKIGFSGK